MLRQVGEEGLVLEPRINPQGVKNRRSGSRHAELRLVGGEEVAEYAAVDLEGLVLVRDVVPALDAATHLGIQPAHVVHNHGVLGKQNFIINIE